MTPGILILKTTSGSHAKELVDHIFGVDSFVVGHELLTIYGDDEETWWHPLAFTLTEQAFFRRFLGGGVSQPEQRKPEMVTTMEKAKQIVHGAAAAVGLVDSAQEIARAKEREANRKLFAQLPERTVAMQTASRELEATNQKIASGELHVGSARPREQDFAHAARLFRACQAARTALFDGAPRELRIRYFRKKRELVSVSSRIHLLTRQQIPDAECELAMFEEKKAAAIKTQAKFSDHHDWQTRHQAADEVRQRTGEVSSLKTNLETARIELGTLNEKLLALQADVAQIDADILAS